MISFCHKLRHIIPDAAVTAVADITRWSDGTQIITSSMRDGMKLCDINMASAISRPFGELNSLGVSISFSPDENLVTWDSSSRTIKIWNVVTDTAFTTPEKGHSQVSSVAFSPDGRQIVTGSDDSTIQLWEAGTGAAIIKYIASSPNGQSIALGGDYTIRQWNVTSHTTIGELIYGYNYTISLTVSSPDGRQIVSGSADGAIWLWNTATDSQIGMSSGGHATRVHSVNFSPDGRHIISSSGDTTIRIWDAETGVAIAVLPPGHTEGVMWISFLSDELFFSSGLDENSRIWTPHFFTLSNIGCCLLCPCSSLAPVILRQQ